MVVSPPASYPLRFLAFDLSKHMKWNFTPWLTNTFVVAASLVLLAFIPAHLVRSFFIVTAGISAIWVYIDARSVFKLTYDPGLASIGLGRVFRSPSASAWLIWVSAMIFWPLWLVALPMYISFRYKRRHNIQKT